MSEDSILPSGERKPAPTPPRLARLGAIVDVLLSGAASAIDLFAPSAREN